MCHKLEGGQSYVRILDRAGSIFGSARYEQVGCTPENDISAVLLPGLDRTAKILAGKTGRQFPFLLQAGKFRHDFLTEVIHNHAFPYYGKKHGLGINAGRGMPGNIQKFVDQFRVQVPVAVAAHRPAALNQNLQPVRVRHIPFQGNTVIGIPAKN
jgi:hypothetical protein